MHVDDHERAPVLAEAQDAVGVDGELPLRRRHERRDRCGVLMVGIGGGVLVCGGRIGEMRAACEIDEATWIFDPERGGVAVLDGL